MLPGHSRTLPFSAFPAWPSTNARNAGVPVTNAFTASTRPSGDQVEGSKKRRSERATISGADPPSTVRTAISDSALDLHVEKPTRVPSPLHTPQPLPPLPANPRPSP